jgi:hypothetical protein
MGKVCGMHGIDEKYLRGFCRGNMKEKPTSRWEDNIKTYLKVIS